MFNRLKAILLQRCPVCLRGQMFHGLFSMADDCPVCGHHFMREQGFFQGAMYVSYGLGVFVFFALFSVIRILLEPRFGLALPVGIALVAYLLLVPVLWRYSRVIWAHLNIGTRERRM
jgi:uncharacterized protein (DUF983 family)